MHKLSVNNHNIWFAWANRILAAHWVIAMIR